MICMGKRDAKDIGCLQREATELVETIRNGSDEVYVFLDTGAFIDFEERAKRARLKDSNARVTQIYDVLNSASSLKLFVNNTVFEESQRHYQGHRINGLPEISEDAWRKIGKMHIDYLSFCRGNRGVGEIDRIGNEVYWATKLAFPNGHKKLVIDEASYVDRNLLRDAIWAREVSQLSGRMNVDSVIVSPDSHIIETVKVLKDEHQSIRFDYPELNLEFGYNGIRTVTSR
jgi:hypothetical protein